MKFKNTHIIGVNSSANDVEILYYPEGAEASDPPFQMIITPHQNHVNVHFGNMGKKILKPDKTCANGVNILLNDHE